MERERDREISSFEKKSLARVQIFRAIFPSHSSNLRFNISRREKKRRKGQVKFELCVILDDLLWV